MLTEQITGDNILDYGEVVSEEMAYHIIHYGERLYSLGMKEEEKAIGALVAFIGDGGFDLEWIFVVPSERGKGYGRTLLDTLETFSMFSEGTDEVRVQLAMRPLEEIASLQEFFLACDFVERDYIFEFTKDDFIKSEPTDIEGLKTFGELSGFQLRGIADRLIQAGFLSPGRALPSATNIDFSVAKVGDGQVTDFIWLLNYYENIIRIGAIVGGGGNGRNLMNTCLYSIKLAKEKLPDNFSIVCEIFGESQYRLMEKLTAGKMQSSKNIVNLVRAV